jgi:drug/metabolite transporter (DMT)-like permease
VAVILLAEPIGATLLAIPLFGEIPTPLKVFGGMLVLAGIFVASRREEQATAAVAAVGEE